MDIALSFHQTRLDIPVVGMPCFRGGFQRGRHRGKKFNATNLEHVDRVEFPKRSREGARQWVEALYVFLDLGES